MIGAHPIDESVPDFDKFKQAEARENLIRAVACLNLTERICGIEVMPLTPYHVRYLCLARSPFLLDDVTVEELLAWPNIVEGIVTFLWVVSPKFQPGLSVKQKWWQRKTAKDKFLKSIHPILKMRSDEVCKEILNYVDEAFIDAERGGAESPVNYFSNEVAIAFEMHEAYNFRVDFWHDEPRRSNPIHVPYKLLLQLRKARAKWNNPEAALTNSSEKIMLAGLAKMRN